jgi:hypothetical protein
LMWQIGGANASLLTALNPMTPIWSIPDLAYNAVWGEYWVSLAVSILVALLVLREAGNDMARHFALREAAIKEPPARDYWAEQNVSEVIGKEKAQWFSGNPIEWLTLRNMGSNSPRRRRITAAGAAFVMLALLAIDTQGTPWILLIGVVFGFIYSVNAAMTFARARQTNEIEMWLTTPLTLNEIVNGHVAALRKTFMWPGLILIAGWAAMFYFDVLRRAMGGSLQAALVIPGIGQYTSPSTAAYVWVCSVLALASLLFALPYVAMWIALRSKRPAQAAVRTFVTMVIFPWFIVLVPKFLLFVPLGRIARKKVEAALRDFAVLERRDVARAGASRV